MEATAVAPAARPGHGRRPLGDLRETLAHAQAVNELTPVVKAFDFFEIRMDGRQS